MAEHDLIIEARKFQIPFNGPDNSAALKAFVDQVVGDLQRLADKSNSLQAQVNYLNRVRFDESLKAIEAQSHEPRLLNFKNYFLSQTGHPTGNEIDYFIDFAADIDISFQGVNERHAFINKKVGVARPPRNNIISFFYQRDGINGLKAISRNPVITITDEPSDPDLKVEYNDPSNMANGSNEFYWYRKYSYPAYSDVSEVTLEFTIQVPIIAGAEPNFLHVDPFPVGDLTINSIGSDGGPIVSTPIPNAPPLSWETPQGITELTFSVTQENFILENGRKIFMVGFKEIDVQQVEWDQTVTSPSKDPIADNHVEVSIPLQSNISEVTDMMVRGDFSHLKVVGSLAGVDDPNVISLSRLAFNDGDTINVAHTFSGAVDKLTATLFLNADPLEDPDRISGSVDHAEIIGFRTE